MLRLEHWRILGWTAILAMMLNGCTGHDHAHQHERVLPPPASADPIAAAALVKGNRYFAERQYGKAQEQYRAAIEAQPALAEAHYNLAVTLYKEGRFKESRPHFVEAANLAPGHPVIWNAPPFRKYGVVETESDEPAPDFGPGGHRH